VSNTLRTSTELVAYALLTSILLGCGGSEDGQKSSQGTPVSVSPKLWALVSSPGINKVIYLPPDRFDDDTLLVAILDEVAGPEIRASRGVQVLFFDNRIAAPKEFPMSDAALAHLRARYNYNPRSRFEEFAFVSDSGHQEQVVRIRPRIRPL